MTDIATTEDVVLIERPAEHVARVVLNRPNARNAINGAVTLALAAAVESLEADPDIWVVILQGAGGKTFCAGADLKAVAAGEGRSLFTREGGFAGFTHVARIKPWIAAVDGHVLAGGLEIALACDFIVAGEASSFGVPEVLRGLIAAAGGAYRLPRLLPRAIAFEMIATGRPIDAAKALQFGMVNRVVASDAVEAEALALADLIGMGSPLAVRESLKLARAALDETDEQLRKDSLNANKVIWGTEDFKEGPRAFIEKRAPRWSGR